MKNDVVRERSRSVGVLIFFIIIFPGACQIQDVSRGRRDERMTRRKKLKAQEHENSKETCFKQTEHKKGITSVSFSCDTGPSISWMLFPMPTDVQMTPSAQPRLQICDKDKLNKYLNVQQINLLLLLICIISLTSSVVH